jgi:hypothetical protein
MLTGTGIGYTAEMMLPHGKDVNFYAQFFLLLSIDSYTIARTWIIRANYISINMILVNK